MAARAKRDFVARPAEGEPELTPEQLEGLRVAHGNADAGRLLADGVVRKRLRAHLGR